MVITKPVFLRLFFLLLAPLFSISQNIPVKKIDIKTAAYKTLTIGVKPDFIAVDGDNAWVVDDHQSRLLKISPNSNTPLLSVSVPEACTAPIVGFGAVWAMSCTEKTLYRIDHNTGALLAKIHTGIADTNGEMSLAVGGGSVWLLSDSSGILTRVNPSNNKVQQTIHVLPFSYGAAFGHNVIWISNYRNNSVQRIDLATNRVVATIPVGGKPRFLAATDKDVFTLNQGDGTVSRVDITLNKTIATIDVQAKGGGGDICADAKNAWVVSTNPERPVQKINLSSNKIESLFTQSVKGKKAVKVDGGARVSDKYVWISGYHDGRVWVIKK